MSADSDAAPTAAAGTAAELGRALLKLARHTIADEFGIPHPPDPNAAKFPALGLPGAARVTLTSGGMLRGSMGLPLANRTLGSDVRANAFAAAFRDTRFAALAPQDFDVIRISVSMHCGFEHIAGIAVMQWSE